MNPNGKIDRNALQKTADSQAAPSGAGRERSTVEVVIAAFFSAALNVPSVGTEDDFFDLGGHSLMAIQVVTQMNETFGTRFDLSVFSGDRVTVASLASQVAQATKQAHESRAAAAAT